MFFRVLSSCVGLSLTVAGFPAVAGQVVTGNIHVCRKPMMMGTVAAIRLMKPPSNMLEAEREKRKLAEIQREQAESCFYASKVEITDNGGDKVDIGWGQWCREFTGKANGEEARRCLSPSAQRRGNLASALER